MRRGTILECEFCGHIKGHGYPCPNPDCSFSEPNKRPNENGSQATAVAPQKQVLALAGMSDEALSREVAERVMGWHKGYQIGHPYWFSGEERDWKVEALHDEHPWQSMDSMSGKIYHRWSPATDIKDAWEVVCRVQELHEGWRFCLLGGDRTMGYAADSQGWMKRDRKGNPIVLEDTRVPFNWKAEFFGECDPRIDYGNRHGEAYAETPARAICEAALLAVARASYGESTLAPASPTVEPTECSNEPRGSAPKEEESQTEATK